MIWVYAILALSVLIIIHEFGHFVAAKSTGMHVDVFSIIGIGPVILRLGKWKGTEFVISAIPFGAYVHIVGMEPEEDETDPKLSAEEKAEILAEREAAAKKAKEEGYEDYRDRPAWAQAAALFGGPFANYLAAILLMVGVFAFVGVPDKVAVADFQDCSAAEAAGLEEGDLFLEVDGEAVNAANLNKVTGAHLGETVDVKIRRDGEEMTVPVRLNDQAPALGIGLVTHFKSIDTGTAIVGGVVGPFAATKKQLVGLGRMISGRAEGNVGGPVEIVRQMKLSAEYGLANFVLFAALISTVLGMFNLLPVPSLDGGRLVFVVWNALVPKKLKVNPITEANIHGYALLALMAFLLYATWGDIQRLRGGDDEEDQKDCPSWMAKADDTADTADAPEDTTLASD